MKRANNQLMKKRTQTMWGFKLYLITINSNKVVLMLLTKQIRIYVYVYTKFWTPHADTIMASLTSFQWQMLQISISHARIHFFVQFYAIISCSRCMSIYYSRELVLSLYIYLVWINYLMFETHLYSHWCEWIWDFFLSD